MLFQGRFRGYRFLGVLVISLIVIISQVTSHAWAQPPGLKIFPHIIGLFDGRETLDIHQNPYRKIVKIAHLEYEKKFPALPSAQCTGSLIGPRLVLTAAHCIFHFMDYIEAEKTHQKFFNKFLYLPMVYAEYDNGKFTKSAKVKAVRFGKFYFEDPRELDWAILVLDQNFGDRFGYFDIDANVALKDINPVASVGFSGDIKNGEVLTGHLNCSVKETEPGHPQQLLTRCDVTRGNSGGPLLKCPEDHPEQCKIVGMTVAQKIEDKNHPNPDDHYLFYDSAHANIALHPSAFTQAIEEVKDYLTKRDAGQTGIKPGQLDPFNFGFVPGPPEATQPEPIDPDDQPASEQ